MIRWYAASEQRQHEAGECGCRIPLLQQRYNCDIIGAGGISGEGPAEG